MAAETHGGGPRDEVIHVSPETRDRLRGWGDAEREAELVEELLDRVELESDAPTWPAGDYY